MRHATILASLLLCACATPLPSATPEELDVAGARVLETSLQLRGIAAACAGAGAEAARQAEETERAWRDRPRDLLVNAGARYAAALPPQPGPDAAAKQALAPLKLRTDGERDGRDRVAATARNAQELARNCGWELEQFANGVRDLAPQAASLPGLRVLALPASASAAEDLDPPAAGREFRGAWRTGTSFAQVDKLLAGKRCPRAAVINVFEDDTRERYVALCESGKRYVARCEFRNCTLE